MTKPVDLELKKAFNDLQLKMLETSKKIQIIDTQISVLDRLLQFVDKTQQEMATMPIDTNTYEAVGRMFLSTEIREVRKNLDIRVAQLFEQISDRESSKHYLEENLKESQDNLREMIQQRKEQIDKSS